MAARGGGFDVMSLVKYGLLAGGAYYIYNHFFAGTPAPAVNAPPATGSLGMDDLIGAIRAAFGGTAPTPAGTTPPPAQSLEDKLNAAAAGNSNFVGGKGNADQWNYYRNQLAPPALSAEDFGKAFPGADRPLMTAAEFLAALHGVGLSGVRILLPRNMGYQTQPDGRKAIVWMVGR